MTANALSPIAWLLPALTAILSTACGEVVRATDAGDDTSHEAPDAPPPPPTDAPACTPTGPVETKVASVALATPRALVLDGAGDRCGQLVRAILDPAQRPPELAALDATSGVGAPLCTRFGDRDAVRFDVLELGGQRLLSTGQWFLAWVEHAGDRLVDLSGWYLEPPATLPASCAPDALARDRVVGHAQRYTSFQHCAAYGGGTWTLAASDARTVVGTGLYFDGKRLRVVKEVDVVAAPSSVTQALTDSDLNCFGLIGVRLIVDADDGKVLDERRHCIVC